MSEANRSALFTNAINTVNSVLETHSDKMPYKQILTAAENVLDDRKLGVAVYKEDPSTPHDFFTVRFDGGTFEVVAHGKEEPDVSGKVSVDYLQELADNPERYLANPLKLDLDWLVSRLGVA